MPAKIEDLVEELEIAAFTPAGLQQERSRLEKRFLIVYGIHAHQIDALIRSGELYETELVQEWIDLHALEPYLTKRRQPPNTREDLSCEGRDGGLFYFRVIIRRMVKRLYSARWMRLISAR